MPKDQPCSACTPAAVRTLCARMGFDFSEGVCSRLHGYLLLLAKWNKVMNLVGRHAWDDILTRLVADSFYLADFIASLDLPPEPECWDLGSGAGLPGLPLRMLWQKGSYALVEAREKRAMFLRTVLSAYPLPGVSAHQARAEAFMPSRPMADLIVSRAFMPWEKVLALVEGNTAPGGFCLFLALEPLPSSLPGGWTAAGDKRYSIAGDSRYFWALRRA